MNPLPQAIVLDSHALTELAANGAGMQSWPVLAQRTGSQLFISAATLAETTNGSARDANIRRVVKAIDVVPVTTDIGYAAGKIRAHAGALRAKIRDLTVDAIVAATALSLRPPTLVLTADKPDFDLLLAGTGIKVFYVN